jgi:hypothetical protein
MTSIVIFDVSGAGLTSTEISARLLQRGVRINGINEPKRSVTH